MKKFIIIITAIAIFYLFNTNTSIIPDEAIRLRVLANSNSDYDQKVKLEVRDYLQDRLYKLLKDTKGIEEARKKIEDEIENIDNGINDVLQKENYNLGYKINFGQNYFPQKKYKGITYNEGYYESLLVTLGSGEGDNWWCVLFPPFCLIEAEESSDVEYKFFIQELIEKYM